MNRLLRISPFVLRLCRCLSEPAGSVPVVDPVAVTSSVHGATFGHVTTSQVAVLCMWRVFSATLHASSRPLSWMISYCCLSWFTVALFFDYSTIA